MRVAYISGIGRSGSTLLDLIISTNQKVFSLGEIYRFNSFNKEIKCACGKRIKDCQFWSRVKKEKLKVINHFNPKDYLKIIFGLINPFSKKINFSNRSENKKLLKLVQKFSDQKKLILDSSKEVGRLIELQNDFKKNYTIYALLETLWLWPILLQPKPKVKEKNIFQPC